MIAEQWGISASLFLRVGQRLGRAGLAMTWLIAVLFLTSGCSSIASSAAAGVSDDLSWTILNQDDPQLVAEGLPAYLLLLDSLVRSDPDNAAIIGAAAELYAAYGSVFVVEDERAQTLTARARQYGNRALCVADDRTCALSDLPFEQYVATVQLVGASDAGALYSYCLANLAYVRAHGDDWNALADLPKVEQALEQLRSLGSAGRAANVNMFLGILNTLRPEALGGKPERGRAYFEQAIQLSGGQDLAAKVEFARGYARLVYDRELHDRLLNEVLEANVQQPGYTLFNHLAQQEAAILLASADDYF